MNGIYKKMQKKAESPNTPVLYIALLSVFAILLSGCEEPQKKTAKQSSVVPPVNLVAQATQIIYDGLSDPDPEIRVRSIEIAAITGQVRMMSKVQRLLKDTIVPVRFLAVVAIGDLEYTLAKTDIKQLLKDKDENVRIAAAYTMTKLGSPEYFKDLCNAVASDNQTVRANAALLLGKTKRKEAIKYLYWTLQQKDSADKVILQAAESIAMLGDERIYPKLWTRLISAYADDRVLGIRAMGALGTDQAKNALITMLSDSVLEVRLAAVEQLGKLKDPIGENEVLTLFNKNLFSGMDAESRERVKVMSAMAIGAIGTEKLIKILPQLLQDESKLVRIAAAKAVFNTTGAK